MLPYAIWSILRYRNEFEGIEALDVPKKNAIIEMYFPIESLN